MKTIDVLGKQCPVPVIEAKKILAEQETDAVLVKVDNSTAVQNLERMAGGYGYTCSCTEHSPHFYEVMISKNGKAPPEVKANESKVFHGGESFNRFAVVIGSNAMGNGAEELGKILIKGFIYSLTELPSPPQCVIFFNSGAYLTSDGSNTLDDLKKLEEKGTEILTCGTCINYFGLQDKLAAGRIVNMYEITEKLACAGTVVNI